MVDKMFKLTIEFETDNAAFGDDEVDKNEEIDRILAGIVKRIYTFNTTSATIHDINGNTLGRWYLGDDPQQTPKS